VSKSLALKACGWLPCGPRIMRSVTLMTRTRRAGVILRRSAAAAITSNVTSTPIPTRTLIASNQTKLHHYKESTHTSGSTPSSTLANFHIDEPATQCCLTLSEMRAKIRRNHFTLSASSGLSQTGVGCLLPTIRFT
jgi:hypothetical protein